MLLHSNNKTQLIIKTIVFLLFLFIRLQFRNSLWFVYIEIEPTKLIKLDSIRKNKKKKQNKSWIQIDSFTEQRIHFSHKSEYFFLFRFDSIYIFHIFFYRYRVIDFQMLRAIIDWLMNHKRNKRFIFAERKFLKIFFGWNGDSLWFESKWIWNQNGII